MNPNGFWKLALILLLGTGLVACQLKPTKVKETTTMPWSDLSEKILAPIVITEQTVILDTRPAFEYNLSHVRGSYNLRWEDLAESSASGALISDLRSVAQRLALLGLTPETPVVIVGKGLEGAGEEGRLGWALLYYGFRDVRIANVHYFGKLLTNEASEPRPNQPLFEIQPQTGLQASKDELLRLALDPDTGKARQFIIDVRSAQEYFAKSQSGQNYQSPEIQAMHIEWKEFFQADGRVNPAIKKRLQGVGVNVGDRIVVISRRGVRSAAVTYALVGMGFRGAASYTGGYRELLTAPGKAKRAAGKRKSRRKK